MLSLNNLASPSANIFFIVEIKCTIFVNLLTTTKIELYPCASSNLVMKSTEIWAQGFSRIEFSINFPASYSMQFLLCWQVSYLSTYHFTSFITPSYQKFLVTNSTVFYCSLCPPTSISWYNLTISALNLLSFGTYTFSSLYITPSTSLYFSLLTISLFLVDQLLL